jgi:hypothetical protein
LVKAGPIGKKDRSDEPHRQDANPFNPERISREKVALSWFIPNTSIKATTTKGAQGETRNRKG